jgi:hypothetical protein
MGKQQAGMYNVATGKYDAQEGTCDDCGGSGELGNWPEGQLTLEKVEMVFGINPQYWDRMERGAVIQSKAVDNYIRLWAAFGSDVKVNKLIKCVHSTNIDLQVGKVYERISDPTAERDGWFRVVDESGEDYLYPQRWFDTNES